MPMTPKEMIKHLKENGFEEVNQNGPHIKLKNSVTGRTVIVPYHSKAMKKGWSRQYLNRHKQAWLK